MIRWLLKSARRTREMDQLSADRLRELLDPKPKTGPAGADGFDGGGKELEAGAPVLEPLCPAILAGRPTDKPLHDSVELADEMAAHFFGFGDWAAPYWFIGLKPGKAPGEDANTSKIAGAWANGLKKAELVDCLEYHRAIGVEFWHKGRARLQPTWRPLILFLMTVLGRESEIGALRTYQQTRWGQMRHAETCVVDLSGIGAKSFDADADREEYLKQRIWAIRRKMMLGGHPPKVVLMHGLAAQSHWEEIAGVPLKPDTVVRVGPTLFVMTPSPVVPGRKNADWERLGLQVRRQLAAE